MNKKTAYTIMFIISVVLVAVIVSVIKYRDWFGHVDSLVWLSIIAAILLILGLIGKNELSLEKKMNEDLHKYRQENVKWMLEPIIERRKKELMQNKGEQK